jgi:HlyD family secretion protein
LNKKILLAIVIAAAAGAAVAVWVWPSLHTADDTNRLTLYGNVDIRQVSLAFNASERIAELRVQEGDKVRAGDVLGTLDMRTSRVRLAQTEAQIGVQDQALLRLKTGSRPEEIAQARAKLAAAESDAALAVRQLARLQATIDATAGKGVGQQDLDNARAHVQVAQAQAEAARQTAALVVKGPRREDIAQADKQLAVAHAEQALIHRQIDESTLRAPTDAVVRARLLEPGDMASPQRPVFTLAITQPQACGDGHRAPAGSDGRVRTSSCRIAAGLGLEGAWLSVHSCTRQKGAQWRSSLACRWSGRCWPGSRLR